MTDLDFSKTESDMTEAGDIIKEILLDVSTLDSDCERIMDLITSDVTVANMIAWI